jgi:hypothetical protein
MESGSGMNILLGEIVLESASILPQEGFMLGSFPHIVQSQAKRVRTRLYARQREEREAQITYFDQYSMQSSLVSDWARENGFSILQQSDSQSIKPVRPFAVKMSLDYDLVDLLSSVFAFHS